jgi:hypothetical protein
MTENASGTSRKTPQHVTGEIHNGAPVEQQLVTLPRPTWATNSEITHSSITAGDTVVHHSWSSPSVGQVWSSGERGPAEVEIVQADVLQSTDAGIVAATESVIIHLSWVDAQFDNTIEARKMAAAILECCDRLDGGR